MSQMPKKQEFNTVAGCFDRNGNRLYYGLVKVNGQGNRISKCESGPARGAADSSSCGPPHESPPARGAIL